MKMVRISTRNLICFWLKTAEMLTAICIGFKVNIYAVANLNVVLLRGLTEILFKTEFIKKFPKSQKKIR
jgi:hypothetical protein